MTTIVQRDNDGNFEYITEPMSIRDRFALETMRGFLSSNVHRWSMEADTLSRKSYGVADAMMRAREASNERT